MSDRILAIKTSLIHLSKLMKTKTFWLNAVGIIFIAVNNNQLIPTDKASEILGILNIFNRLLTYKPVSEK